MKKPIAILAPTVEIGLIHARDMLADRPHKIIASRRQVLHPETGDLLAFVAVNIEHLRGRRISGFWIAGHVPHELVLEAEWLAAKEKAI